ncbi:CobN component of cobalt chelatase involved in B12 biosynthesis [Roseibacterium elongatum DSM 19469]|uniref:CobN component of cobalt chelatase involved in B12 biosynthesis n=1 Tax=Roseicyclus elongatus DSM 19469 TaxID=1294273 RepID=W8S2U2_9RHOB|nr:CobN component of cobalt chelatase involved in B12 biosynthesis [Roseibacterium elongatum DSM 19469]
MPALRLANIAALKHPRSVDAYVEQTLQGAKGILIRLIGGAPYWPYGLQRVEALARQKGIALAVLPADGRPDPRLDAVSTVPVSTLRRLASLCDSGGAVAAQAALAQMALAAGLYAGPVPGAKTLPQVGAWTPEDGVSCPAPARFDDTAPLVLVIFYRSYLVAADLAPIEALFAALRARGFRALGLFAPSLKAPEARVWLDRQIGALCPAAIVNATSFSGRDEGGTSPLDAAGVPVFQVALATSTRAAWAAAESGLSPADLAMHVVLPEMDGRLFAGVASFKEPGARDAHLQFSRHVHMPEAGRVDAIADRVAAWHRLSIIPPADRRVALVLSTCPGRDWNMAHAAGLDALASAEAILDDLSETGYRITEGAALNTALSTGRIAYPMATYRAALSLLPKALRDDLQSAWGAPEADPDATPEGFAFAAVRRGNALVLLQPDPIAPAPCENDDRAGAQVPRHAYVAFFLWLRTQTDAVVHIGTHGALEWLAGKAVALSETCWPEALIGDLPVIYPFIVNDPGAAAQAKRRIGAVTIGHVPPPLKASGTPPRLARLEALLNEVPRADELHPRTCERFMFDIRNEAQAHGIEKDIGITEASCPTEAIARINRFVRDVTDSEFGDGLHVWGRARAVAGPFDTAASAKAERQALLDALSGRRIDSGPSGSPYRGRADVLPTGRNLYTTDPRSVPSRAAFRHGVALAEELIRRHRQENGEWPRALVVDLAGAATMRTAGEEFAMALALLGVRPVWDDGSERVSGLDIIPIAALDRPRIDVTLRVSGLFRDAFPTLSALFQQAVRALSQCAEAPDWTPYSGRDAPRVYGPAPGRFDPLMGPLLGDLSEQGRHAAGEAWLAASSWALDGETQCQDLDGLKARVAQADAFVQLQDLPETDLLLAPDYASQGGGFAAAQGLTGGSARLYHLDTTDPSRPRARTLTEDIARLVQARAANPAWIAGMRRHGAQGAAEIAATLENMAAFAHLAGVVGPHLFELFWDATLGDPEVTDFLEGANAAALAAMRARFSQLQAAGYGPSPRRAILADAQSPRLETGT